MCGRHAGYGSAQRPHCALGIRGSKDRVSGDQDACPCGDDSRSVLLVNAAIDLDGHRRSGFGQYPANMTQLFDAVWNERLPAEPRLTRHDPDVVAIAGDVLQRNGGCRWIEYGARARPQFLDEMNRPMKMRHR